MSELLQSYAARIAAYRPRPGEVGVFWLGQAGFILRGEGGAIAIDTYLSAREGRRYDAPVRADELGFVDAFLATHEHRDHLDRPQLAALAAASPRARFVVPAPIAGGIADVPRDRIVAARPDEPLGIGRARIMPVRARHGVHVADAYAFGLEPGEDRYLGYVVEIDGVRIYHAGDTIRYDGQAERLRELDVHLALLPINGRSAEREAQDLVGNLAAAEAADLAADAGARAVVPMHYELFAWNDGRAADLVERASSAHHDLEVIVLPRYGGAVYRSV